MSKNVKYLSFILDNRLFLFFLVIQFTNIWLLKTKVSDEKKNMTMYLWRFFFQNVYYYYY